MYGGKHELNILHDGTKTTSNSQSNTKKNPLFGGKENLCYSQGFSVVESRWDFATEIIV